MPQVVEVFPGDSGLPAGRVTSRVQGEGKLVRRGSSRWQYGHVVLIMEPWQGAESGCGLRWEVPEELIPSAFAGAVLAGVRSAFADGACGYRRLERTCIRVVGGSFAPPTANDHSYLMAARLAVLDALKKCQIAPTGEDETSPLGDRPESEGRSVTI